MVLGEVIGRPLHGLDEWFWVRPRKITAGYLKMLGLGKGNSQLLKWQFLVSIMLDFWRADRFFGATTFMVVEEIRRLNQLKWRIFHFSWGFIATGGAGCLNHQQYGLVGREKLGEMIF